MTRSRKTDLERGIRESYSLIREYETILRLSSDPKERARARHAIEEQWALTQESLDEYVSLSERLGERISDEIDEILNHFRTKDQRLLMLGEEFKGAKTRNLPPLSRHFVDRDDEIELLKERFKDYQAPIALVGLGGIGKTSLAIAAIEALEEEGRFGGGIFGLDGVQYTTLGALVMRLGELLRLDLSQRTLLEQRQAVSYMLRDRDALILVDSFESLGEAEATVDFLRGLPCNVLITSRVRRSEFHDPFIVDSLPGNPAKELFAALTQESLLEDPETDALCLQDLGGHPLAIEVIAAWARFGMTPQELRQSLREAPGIVLGEDQEADELGGVAKALYLSYSQLEPSAQNVLSCASVFRTQFDIAALSALLPGQTRLQLAKAMRQLQERSLLQVVGYNSYRLHAVTGQYAYGKLADKPAAHRRAAAYYLSEQGDDSLAAVEQLVRAGERDEAAGLVPQHVEAWIHAGRASEALVILDEFDLVQVSPTHQATICEAKGDLLYLLGELDEAIVQFERAVESAALAKGGTRARLHRKLAEVLSRKGEHEQALNRLLQGRALLAEGEDLREEGARLAASYGTVLLALGRYDEAIEEAQKAIYRLHNLAAFPRTAADLYDLMGKAYAFTGDLAASLERFQSALELREACSDLRGVVRSHSNLAFVYGEQNLYDEAIQANQTAIDLAESLDDKIALSTLYMNMAADCMDRGDFDQASDLNMQALSLAEQMGYVYQLSILHHNLGELHRHTERLDLSVEHFEQAIELANQVDYQSGVIGGMAGLAEVYLAQGRIQEALSQCMESLRLAEHLANQYWRPASLYLLGRIHYAMRHWDRARSAFSEARQLWRERGACIDLYDLLQSWAQLEKDAGQIGRARELGKEAAAMADRLDASD